MPLITLRSARMDSDAGESSLRRALEAAEEDARASGFDGLELDLGPFESIGGALSQIAVDGDAFAAARAIRGRLAARSVGQAIDDVRAVLERLWGAQVGVFNLALPALAGSQTGSAGSSYREALDFAGKLLQGVRRDAERAGVAVALEACSGSQLLSPVEMADLIDDAGSWAVGAAIDTALVSRLSPAGEWIASLGRRVRAVRIPAGDKGTKGVELMEEFRRLAGEPFLATTSPLDEIFIIADESPKGALAISQAEPIR
ncbi:MAG: hypothetical protein J5J06_10185 [Phycisphaerae bacterium]|nr:hypothetical protein [Phycisphaerae bacterium]